MHAKIKDMEKTLHVHTTITGPDVDKFQVRDYLDNLSDDLDFQVTTYQSNIYFTEFRKPEVKLKKAEHPNKDGQDSYKVTTGK